MAKEKQKKNSRKLYEYYQLKEDKVERKNKSCIKCGPGYFLAQHQNRLTCGKCGYAEFISKS